MMTTVSRPLQWLACLALMFVSFQATTQPGYAQIVPLGQRGCASGTVVGGPNLVFNGDFSIDPGPGPGIDPAAGFESSIINRGPNVYPDDGVGGGFSIQTGAREYRDGLLVGKPFPGDPERDAPASQTYFYSNPLWNEGVTEVLLWRQTVAVVGGTTYNFFAYFDNLINASGNDADPVIALRVDGVAAGPAVVVPEIPDEWIPVQFAFTTAANQTQVTLEIYDLAQNSIGDDFAMTQISLRQCVSGLGIAKLGTFTGRNSDGTYGLEYVITLQNYGVDPEPIRSIQVTDDLSQTFANAAAFSVESVTSSTLAVNPTYDGVTDVRLLAPGNQLAAQQTATITLRARVVPGSGPNGSGPFANSARATATVGNLTIQDDSIPGTNPDPEGSGNPKGANEPTTTPLVSRISLPFM